MARCGTVDDLVAEHVARVTMDRAVKRNALDDELTRSTASSER